MDITLKPRTAALTIALLGVLLGLLISQVALGGGQTARASSGGVYAIVRQLEDINVKLGNHVAGSIEDTLERIELDTERACKELQGHQFGTCSESAPVR
jgi:hypothetical protein